MTHKVMILGVMIIGWVIIAISPLGGGPLLLGQTPESQMFDMQLDASQIDASQQSVPQPPRAVTAEGDRGMVVCVSPPAAAVGVAVLRKGGNAVDAAVAVAFALAVTWPEAGNIGGGGFMLVAPPRQEPTCFEFRETAPAKAPVDLFADGTVTPFDHRAVGVPGTVRGLALAHQRYGKLPWNQLLQPAIELAADGFVVNEALARSLNRLLADPATTHPECRRVFGKPDGTPWRAGDRLVQPDLSRTLRRIAEDGPDAFYTGLIAEQIEKEMRAGGGLIRRDDLKNYRAHERTPIHSRYRGYDIYAPPPPSSGGVTLAIILNILEQFELRKQGRWSAATQHLLVEAMRRAYVDRARHLGDPDFVPLPPRLLTKDYARELARTIRHDRATPSRDLAPDIDIRPDGESTTHFSIVDRDGLAVSTTYTLEHSFGSRIVVRGGGFLLNNEMVDFNPKPGVTTTGGLIGTKPNLIAPGKRMLSSMTPTVVRKDGELVLVTGSPGGRTIINTVACVLVNVIDFQMAPADAVAAPRLHHQWLPDVVRFEGTAEHPQLVAELQRLGHRVVGHRQGDAHTIMLDRGRRIGVADKRIDGQALGE